LPALLWLTASATVSARPTSNSLRARSNRRMPRRPSCTDPHLPSLPGDGQSLRSALLRFRTSDLARHFGTSVTSNSSVRVFDLVVSSHGAGWTRAPRWSCLPAALRTRSVARFKELPSHPRPGFSFERPSTALSGQPQLIVQLDRAQPRPGPGATRTVMSIWRAPCAALLIGEPALVESSSLESGGVARGLLERALGEYLAKARRSEESPARSDARASRSSRSRAQVDEV